MVFNVGDRVRKTDPDDNREGLVMEVKNDTAKVLFDQARRGRTAQVECSWVKFDELTASKKKD